MEKIMKFKLVLITGIQIEFNSNDKIKVNGVITRVDNMYNELKAGEYHKGFTNIIYHEADGANLVYYILAEKISWAYLQEQEVKDEPTTN